MTKQTLKQYFMDRAACAEVMGHALYFNCDSFAYTGRVVDVEMEKYIVLEDAMWVFETGEFSTNKWGNAERVPSGYYRIAIDKIEGFGDFEREHKTK
jgi:hypothetical protein